MRLWMLALLTLIARAQTAAPKPAFETASIKLTGPKGGGGHSHERDAPGLLRASMTLKSFIVTAYGVRSYQVAGGPNWIDDSTYEIVARLEHADVDPTRRTDEERIHEALQTLLADRFQLKFHRETREEPSYALVPAKGGFKLKPSAQTSKCGSDSNGDGPGRTYNARCVNMDDFLRFLARQLDRPIFDRTQLAGQYDFTLRWMPENPRDPAADSSGLPTLFEAIQDTLGLRIEAVKAPVETIVVDSAERPGEN